MLSELITRTTLDWFYLLLNIIFCRLLWDAVCKFTGWTKEQLASALVALIYDGVFASPEERRAAGLGRAGGGLDLCRRVEEYLGMISGSITGHWDIGHQV